MSTRTHTPRSHEPSTHPFRSGTTRYGRYAAISLAAVAAAIGVLAGVYALGTLPATARETLTLTFATVVLAAALPSVLRRVLVAAVTSRGR